MWEIELKKYEACFVKYCSESIKRVIKQKSSEIWSENGSSKICQIGRWNYNIGKILFSKEYRMSQIKVKILHKKRLCQKWSFFGRPPNPRASPFSLISLYIITLTLTDLIFFRKKKMEKISSLRQSRKVPPNLISNINTNFLQPFIPYNTLLHHL